jgi:hypothetical protein
LLHAAQACHQEGLESFSRADLIDRIPDELPDWSEHRLLCDKLLTSYLYQLVWIGLFEIQNPGEHSPYYRLIEPFNYPGLDELHVHELDWLRFFHKQVSVILEERLKLRLQYQRETGNYLDDVEEYVAAY